MTDMEIPPAAIEDAVEAYLAARYPLGGIYTGNRALPNPLSVGIRAAIAAALPHLQADTKADQICGDIACPGLANCKDPDCSLAKAKPFMEGATELGRRLGRQEAAEEIAAGLIARGYGPGSPSLEVVRDIGKGDPTS